MHLTKIFKNRNTQAVHIPAELAFARLDIDYEIERIGNELRIRPAPRSLADVMSKFTSFSEDFIDEDRNDQIQAERDIFK